MVIDGIPYHDGILKSPKSLRIIGRMSAKEDSLAKRKQGSLASKSHVQHSQLGKYERGEDRRFITVLHIF